ncbi:H-NS histone family protein [Massilia sp. DD77]|uniref:H-NS histone family protein n=1 Tax=Massilia sp. DD77 TaxID=3109349 RepID=UPI002FFDACD0
MANIDLSGYNLSELKGLQHDIEKEIKSRQHQDLQKAREQILAIAQEAGVSVQELLATSDKKLKQGKGKGQKVQARYKNPENNTQTWTGRGRQPKWIAEGIAGGKSLDDFRI